MQKLPTLLTFAMLLAGIAAGPIPSNAQATPATDDKAAIKALYDQFDKSFVNKNVDAIMALFGPNVFVFDVVPPRQYSTWAAYKKDWQDLFAAFPGPLTNKLSELNITVAGPVAYTHYIDDTVVTAKDGTKLHLVSRSTDVLRKENGKWLIELEHNSVPVDLTTGKPDMLSKP